MFGFYHGATHVEVIVSPDGEIEVIDFNPRLWCGADVIQSMNFAFEERVEKWIFSNSLVNHFKVIPEQKISPASSTCRCPLNAELKTVEFPVDKEIVLELYF